MNSRRTWLKKTEYSLCLSICVLLFGASSAFGQFAWNTNSWFQFGTTGWVAGSGAQARIPVPGNEQPALNGWWGEASEWATWPGWGPLPGPREPIDQGLLYVWGSPTEMVYAKGVAGLDRVGIVSFDTGGDPFGGLAPLSFPHPLATQGKTLPLFYWIYRGFSAGSGIVPPGNPLNPDWEMLAANVWFKDSDIGGELMVMDLALYLGPGDNLQSGPLDPPLVGWKHQKKFPTTPQYVWKYDYFDVGAQLQTAIAQASAQGIHFGPATTNLHNVEMLWELANAQGEFLLYLFQLGNY